MKLSQHHKFIVRHHKFPVSRSTAARTRTCTSAVWHPPRLLESCVKNVVRNAQTQVLGCAQTAVLGCLTRYCIYPNSELKCIFAYLLNSVFAYFSNNYQCFPTICCTILHKLLQNVRLLAVKIASTINAEIEKKLGAYKKKLDKQLKEEKKESVRGWFFWGCRKMSSLVL